ncbi:MAG: helix-turn-helix domain-containing protein [Pseudomonadota bacterium]
MTQEVQDPHRTAPVREKNLELAIGHALKRFRMQKSFTLADLAEQSGLSIAMVSKIENGQTSPSLASLHGLANALSIPLTAFFREFEETREVVHTPAGAGQMRKDGGTRGRSGYSLLGHLGANTSGVTVEPYLITLTEDNRHFPPFQHEGIETIYMLEGEVIYSHGERTFHLRPGDTLFFDADAPHGPLEVPKLPARYVSVIAYPLRGG